MKLLRYFAYGANLETNRLRRWCQEPVAVVGRACLPGYECGFDRHGYANVRLKPGGRVWGICYELSPAALQRIDQYEDYPTVYQRRIVTVRLNGRRDETTKAWVYLEPPENFGYAPKPSYLRRILAAARQHGVPREWINTLAVLDKTR